MRPDVDRERGRQSDRRGEHAVDRRRDRREAPPPPAVRQRAEDQREQHARADHRQPHAQRRVARVVGLPGIGQGLGEQPSGPARVAGGQGDHRDRRDRPRLGGGHRRRRRPPRRTGGELLPRVRRRLDRAGAAPHERRPDEPEVRDRQLVGDPMRAVRAARQLRLGGQRQRFGRQLQDGWTKREPSCSGGSSTVNPGPRVAISMMWPSGSRR